MIKEYKTGDLIEERVQVYFAQYDKLVNKLTMLDEWNKDIKYDLKDTAVYAIIPFKQYVILQKEGLLGKLR